MIIALLVLLPLQLAVIIGYLLDRKAKARWIICVGHVGESFSNEKVEEGGKTLSPLPSHRENPKIHVVSKGTRRSNTAYRMNIDQI